MSAKSEGMSRAAQRDVAWFAMALHDWVKFVAQRGETTAEEWRGSWIRRDKPEPKSHYVWGAVVHIAHQRGLIRHTGRYVLAKSVATHSHPVAIWAGP